MCLQQKIHSFSTIKNGSRPRGSIATAIKTPWSDGAKKPIKIDVSKISCQPQARLVNWTRARNITRGNKNTTERHNRAAGSPKTPDRSTKAEIPLVNITTRVRSQYAKKQKNLLRKHKPFTIFQTIRSGAKRTRICAQSSPPDGGGFL